MLSRRKLWFVVFDMDGRSNSDESSTVMLHVMCKGRWILSLDCGER